MKAVSYSVLHPATLDQIANHPPLQLPTCHNLLHVKMDLYNGISCSSRYTEEERRRTSHTPTRPWWHTFEQTGSQINSSINEHNGSVYHTLDTYIQSH